MSEQEVGGSGPITGTYDGQVPAQGPPVLALAELFLTDVADRFLASLAAAGFPMTLAKSRLVGVVPEGGVHLTALADRVGVTKQSCGQMVTELEAEGYLERVPDPDDGRAKLIRWGPEARASMPAAYAAMRDVDAHLVDVLGPEDAARLRSLLLRYASAGDRRDRAG